MKFNLDNHSITYIQAHVRGEHKIKKIYVFDTDEKKKKISYCYVSFVDTKIYILISNIKCDKFSKYP